MKQYVNKIIHAPNKEVLCRLPEDCIDLTVTSPPYDDLRNYKGYNFDFEHVARELYRITKPGGVVVWVVGDSTIDGSESCTSFKHALFFKEIGFNLHDTMIYQKDGMPNAGNRYQQSFEYMFVLSIGRPRVVNLIKRKAIYYAGHNKVSKHTMRENDNLKDKRYVLNEYRIIENIWKFATGLHGTTSDKEAFKHPAMFPEKLARDHILSWSNKNDLVLDPFSGAGTTCKMAYKYDRKYIGIDISEEYCEIARERLKIEQMQQRLTI